MIGTRCNRSAVSSWAQVYAGPIGLLVHGAASSGRFIAIILAIVVVAVAAAIAYNVSSSFRTGTASNIKPAAHSAMDPGSPALLAPNH